MYTLTKLVQEMCIQKGDVGFNRAALFFMHGVNCLRELSMDFVAIPKNIEIPINPDDTCDLPCDFLNYISVSAIGLDGRLHGLGKNNHLNLVQYYNNCGVPIQRVPTNNTLAGLGNNYPYLINPTYIANHWRNGENMGGYFNAGGNNLVGYYRFDMNRNQIVLGQLRWGVRCLVLEYISDLSSEAGEFIVHPFIIETVKRWIAYQLIVDSSSASLGEKQLAERNYNVSRKASIRRFRSSTTQEWLDATRRGNTGIPSF